MKNLFEDLTDYILNTETGVSDDYIASLFKSCPEELETVIKCSDGFDTFQIWYRLAERCVEEMEA